MLEKICNDEYKSIVIDKTGLAPEVIERDLNDSDPVTITIATDVFDFFTEFYKYTPDGVLGTSISSLLKFLDQYFKLTCPEYIEKQHEYILYNRMLEYMKTNIKDVICCQNNDNHYRWIKYEFTAHGVINIIYFKCSNIKYIDEYLPIEVFKNVIDFYYILNDVADKIINKRLIEDC